MQFISLGHATGIVATGGTRVLVDPWLTRRLDRMWERSPAIDDSLWEVIEEGIDAVVLTHHHCDHLHYPTLRLLRSRLGEEWAKRVPVYYPAPASSRFTGSGMGHLPISLTLRLCGYPNWRPVQVGKTVEFADLKVRTFPSRVGFPEMSLCFENSDGVIMWCADAMLHPDTWEQVTARSFPPIGVALVPAHSYTPGNVLTERKLIVSYEASRRRSETNFDRYASTMDAELLIPFACGWSVNALEPGFDWCNGLLYPFTPVDAYRRTLGAGRQAELSGPGLAVELAGGHVDSVDRLPGAATVAQIEAASRAITLDPSVAIPPFDGSRDRTGMQTAPAEVLVRGLIDEFTGTDVWCDALTQGRRYRITVHDEDDAHSWRYDAADQRLQPVAPGDSQEGEDYIEIAGSTLSSLLAGRLTYGSSWGLWTSNCAMLSAVFHHPKWHLRHLAALEGGPEPEYILA